MQSIQEAHVPRPKYIRVRYAGYQDWIILCFLSHFSKSRGSKVLISKVRSCSRILRLSWTLEFTGSKQATHPVQGWKREGTSWARTMFSFLSGLPNKEAQTSFEIAWRAMKHFEFRRIPSSRHSRNARPTNFGTFCTSSPHLILQNLGRGNSVISWLFARSEMQLNNYRLLKRD